MNLHRPDIAIVDAARRQPLPMFATVFAYMNFSQRSRVKAIGIEWVRRDLTDGFAVEGGV
jgi:hypothetical protein